MNSFSLEHWVVFGFVVWVCWRMFRNRTASTQREPDQAAGASQGAPGGLRYSTEVVGESFHTASFIQLLGGHAGTDDESFWPATLRLETKNEHDPLAVSVWVRGLQVGHLSRDGARAFRRSAAVTAQAGRHDFEASARIYAGGEDRRFSVTLSLPLT